jgi:hypothetical protein
MKNNMNSKSKKKIEKFDQTIHFGIDKVNFTELHNELVPIRNKINEIIEAVNKINGEK